MQGLLGGVPLHRVPPVGLHVLWVQRQAAADEFADGRHPAVRGCDQGCPECRSAGGHWFAAVNGNTIQIYSTYTCEAYGNLRGHNGKVRSISWTADDARLVSAGMDSAVYSGTQRLS